MFASLPKQGETKRQQGIASVGVVLADKINNALSVDFQGNLRSYLKEADLEFASERKRMSVVVRDTLTHKLFLLCKGADDVMLPRLAVLPSLVVVKEQLEHYAGR